MLQETQGLLLWSALWSGSEHSRESYYRLDRRGTVSEKDEGGDAQARWYLNERT
jgi:hypothetical protein